LAKKGADASDVEAAHFFHLAPLDVRRVLEIGSGVPDLAEAPCGGSAVTAHFADDVPRRPQAGRGVPGPICLGGAWLKYEGFEATEFARQSGTAFGRK
jgi:hypothetical protein